MRKDYLVNMLISCFPQSMFYYWLQIACALHKNKTPQVGIEPTTYRLTADRSTAELLGISSFFK
jgi:hypothetical protein